MTIPMNAERIFTNLTPGGPVTVRVRDGKITGIEPLVVEKGEGDWTIEARGKRFSPPHTTRISPYTIAERSRVYCKERILTPLKRVDFSLTGERNQKNRGISGYEAISWDEAIEIVSSEITRIQVV